MLSQSFRAWSEFRNKSQQNRAQRRKPFSLTSTRHCRLGNRALQAEALEPRIVLTGDIVISELMAVNNTTLNDTDGSSTDWIELFNNSTEPVNIDGWYLTDDPAALTKWQFPDVTIGADEFLVVFASDKDRRDPNSEMHTNFKLTSAGEYLGLIQADGTTISHEYGTLAGETFPEQLPDVSYGVEQTTLDYSLVADGAEVGVLIPTSAGEDLPAATWTAVGYDDGSWPAHNLGIGFDGGGELLGELSANGDLTAEMQGNTASAYVRAEFTIDGPVPEMDALTMNINYDDGYVAYLNGVEVASGNAPAALDWSAQATQNHGGELTSIGFDGFSDEDIQNLFTTNGTAKFGGDVLKITEGINRTSSTWLTDPLDFGADYTFSTSFAMEVHTPFGLPFLEQPDADGNGGQGMTFVLQAGGPFQLGGGKGELGLDNAGMTFVAVEFDTFTGGSFDDDTSPPTHIGIDTSAAGSVASVGVPRFNGGAEGENPRNVWVDYDGFTDTMDVFFSETNIKPANPTLSATVDLESLFGGVPELWAGFTGATSFNANTHEVSAWEITTFSNELGLTTETVDLSDHIGLLQTGTNVLAIHGLNLDANDDDFLVDATLDGALNNVTFLDATAFFTAPTPGEPNGSGSERPASKVEFSISGRTFTDSVTVAVTATDPDSVIRYTTDGTLPNEFSTEYTGPMTVTETTRIRARAFEEGLAPGPVQTQSYIQMAPDVTSFEGGVFESNIPIFVFDSFGDGAANSDGSNFHSATALVYDVGADGVASLADEPDFTGQLGMRIRGQSSQGWPKKQYALEFWDESIDYTGAISGRNGPDTNVKLLDLPAESDWVLQGPYADKTQLNNYLAFNLYRDVGQLAPRVRLVEAFVNVNGGTVDYATDYRGTYILLEKNKIDNNRVDVDDPISNPLPGQDPATVGGYLFKQDKGGANDVTFSTSGHGGPSIPLKFHDPDTPSDEQRAWLSAYVNEFEAALYSADFTDPEIGYRKYIDVDSWIDHWLITELAKEIDGYRISEYFFLNREGKIEKGPGWDFNLSFSNANYLDGGIWTGFYGDLISGSDYHWYPQLFRDPAFEAELQDRWFELREDEFALDTLLGMVDDAVEALTDGSPNYDTPAPGEPSNPISRNYDRWNTIIDDYLWPNCFFNEGGTCRENPLPAGTGKPNENNAPNSYDDYVFIMKDFITNRVEWIDNEFGKPPQFDPPGGIIPDGTLVTLTTDQTGTIFYTTDGTDPQLQQANAVEYTDPISIDQNMIVTARSYNAATDVWSARSSQTYFVDVPPLVVTELNYNPAAATGDEIAALFGGVAEDADNDAFEYMEIMNVGSDPFDLTGVTIVDGVDFTFESGSLAAGERGVIVRNQAAFEFRYGAGLNILGSWANPNDPFVSDKLSNDGEHILIQGPLGEPTMDFTYNDAWYPLTDGDGFTLVITDPNADPGTWSSATSWRPSDFVGGSPGTGDAGIAPLHGSVIVNEVVANSSTGNDAIELRNTTDNAVNIGSFFLTDDPSNLEKFVIPAGTIVPANGYTVIDRSDIGTFALADTGGRIILQAANAAGEYLGFQTDRRFDAAFADTSEGVYTNSLGNVDFVNLSSVTLGSANADPTIGPVVINEIMYNPPLGEPEWFELKNISASTVNLGADLWVAVEGIDYAFPSDATLEAGGFALLVQGTDGGDAIATANAFRADNGVPANVSIYVYEPTANGSLDNAGEDIAIGRSLDVGLPAVRFDLIEYDNTDPWPSEPDGNGTTLTRIDAASYGNEPGNWGVGGLGGSPGEDNDFQDLTPPTMPTDVHGNLEATGEIVIAWGPSVDPESGVDHYNIYRDGTIVGTSPYARFAESVQFTSAPIVYTVSAVNGDGVESSVSDTSVDFSAESLNFQEGVGGYTGAADVEIRSAGAPSPIGQINVDGEDGGGKTFGLLRWDNLTAVPEGGVIVGIEIQVTTVDNSYSTYQVQELNQPWDEDQATWTDSGFGAWDGPGASGAADLGAVVGDVPGGSNGATVLNASAVTMVQSWIDNPDENHGVIFNEPPGGGTDGLDFYTRENADPSRNPRLTILFVQPPTPSDHGDLDVDGTFDVDDINLLIQGIQNGATESAFDMDASGVVDTDDIGEWLSIAGDANIGTPYVPGDTDLDGDVDAGDLNVVGISWQQNVAGWSQADFNADGIVNASDLNDVGINWLHGVAAAAPSARAPRAPLAVQIDAAHAAPANAVLPTEIAVPTTRKNLRTVAFQAGDAIELDAATLTTRHPNRQDSHRAVIGQPSEPEHEDLFQDLADDVFGTW